MTSIKQEIIEFKKYWYLFKVLVDKGIRKKYEGSFLGVIWSLLNPLLFMVVLTLIFSTLFAKDIENFPVYLLTGRLLYSFFASSTSSTMKCIRGFSSILNKIYVPKLVFLLSKVVSEFVIFLISMIDLVLIMIVTGADFSLNILFSPIYLALLFLFSTGAGFVLATLGVFFRDIEHIYNVFLLLLRYLSAIIYPIEIIPKEYRFIIEYNPLYQFIYGFRNCVYYGKPPELYNLIFCIVVAVLSFVIGLLIFKKNEDKFLLYL
jgi:ABC-2 type transport system permease protein/lipopolysaccharide transport system permease protein